jgi:TolA-binding protein
VYLIGAQIMLGADSPDQAQHILEYLIEHYPTDPSAVQARRYLAQL